MGGLREEIRMELQVLEPTTRYKAISMARNVERKLVRAGILKAPAIGRRYISFREVTLEKISITIMQEEQITQHLNSSQTLIWVEELRNRVKLKKDKEEQLEVFKTFLIRS